jgi:hypothetical protein
VPHVLTQLTHFLQHPTRKFPAKWLNDYVLNELIEPIALSVEGQSIAGRGFLEEGI